MTIEVESATFQLEVTYQELQTIKAALSADDSPNALDLEIEIEDSLCCLL